MQLDALSKDRLRDEPPEVGDLVQVRSRRWLVEEVQRPNKNETLMALSH